jgi:hypothetical protein
MRRLGWSVTWRIGLVLTRIIEPDRARVPIGRPGADEKEARMTVPDYVVFFLAGLVLAIGLVNLLYGWRGARLARWLDWFPGVRNRSRAENIGWGLSNVAVAVAVMIFAGDFTADLGLNTLAVGLGALGITVAALYRGLTVVR